MPYGLEPIATNRGLSLSFLNAHMGQELEILLVVANFKEFGYTYTDQFQSADRTLMRWGRV